VTTSRFGKGLKTYRFTFACVDPRTGYAVPNNGIQISDYKPVAFSGAHDDATRPKGSYSPEVGITNGSGYWTTTYTAPEEAGIVESKLICNTPTGTTAPYAFTIGIRTPGFTELPTGYSEIS